MYNHEKEAGALLSGAWFYVLLWRSCFMSFSVVRVVSHFADLGGGDLDVEL